MSDEKGSDQHSAVSGQHSELSTQHSAPSTQHVAVLKPQRRFSFVWIIPLLALALAGWLTWRAWTMRGLGVMVTLPDGHGLKAGDEVRYRGITVGRVDAVTLSPDMSGVIIHTRLTSQADMLARAGTRFWVVRPQLHLTRIQGLETIIGPRFLAALPAPPQSNSNATSAKRQRTFVGVDEPPIIESTNPGDLEIVLQSSQRGSLHPGAPVTYRQTRVGTVLSVGLAGDGGSIESRLIILQPFIGLIRPNTKFWDSGGLQAHVGLTGVTIDIDSAEALLTGGVALATPPPDQAGGDIVRTGHRYVMSPEPEEEWREWQPLVAIGSSLLPPGASPPSPMRATIGWKQGRLFTSSRSRHGWVLQTSDGLLGPSDLMKPGDSADADTVVLEVNGTIVPLTKSPAWEKNGLAMMPANASSVKWPMSRIRKAQEPEECLAIADPVAAPLPLAAAKLTPTGDAGWHVDEELTIDPSWHGAAVVSRTDGALVGLLLVTSRGEATVALVGE